MATQLQGSLVRELLIPEVDSPLVLTLTETGIDIRVKGFTTKLHGSWAQVIAALTVPSNVPSPVAYHPLGFLRYQISKKGKQ